MCTEGVLRVSESADLQARLSSEPQDGGATEPQGGAAFDVARVHRALAGTMFAGKVHHFVTIDSTQTRAIADAQAGAEAGTVYVADAQTAGRGRGGHTWHSEPDSGLYVTVLMRPALRAERALLLSLATGLAAQAALQTVSGLAVDLRWPNDLVTHGAGSRKLGGILTESAMQPDGTMRYAAVGIGINLNQPAMSPDLLATSTSVRMVLGRTTQREELLVALLKRLEAELLLLEQDASSVLARFASASTWVRGKRVHVAEDEGYTAVTDGLTEAGLLRVRDEAGERRVVRHGGVREAQ